jgi:flavin-dependent dehydrogenase
VFAKAEHVNVGVGGWKHEGPRLRDHLAELCAAHGADVDELTDVRGWRLPLRQPEHALARGPVAVLGDAGGLVDPLSGDGMYEGFASARLAAAAVEDLLAGRAHTLDGYATAVGHALGRLTAAGWAAQAALDRFPQTAYWWTRLPQTWKVVEKILLGELGHPGAARGLELGAMKLFDALARRAGSRARAYLPAST